MRLLIDRHMKGRIAFAELLKSGHDLVLISALDGADRVRENRTGEGHRWHDMAGGRFPERVACLCRLELRNAADAARTGFVDRDLRLAVQENQLPQMLLRPVVQIQNIAVGPDAARQNTEKRKLADMRIQHRLEHKSRRRSVRSRFHNRSVRRHARPLQRILADVDDAVHHLRHPDVPGHASGKDRNQRAGLQRVVKTGHDLRLRQLFSAEIALHQRFVRFGNRIEQNLLALGGVLLEIVGNLRRIAQHADHPFQSGSPADRKRHRNADILPVRLLKLFHYLEEIRILPVQTVDERQFRNVEALSQFERTACADFQSVGSVEHHQRGSAGSVGRDDLPDKRSVSRRVRKEEAVTVPFAAHVGRVDARAFFLLVRRKVRNAGLGIHGSQAVHGFRLVEHPVAEGGLSAAAVPGYDEIADLGRFKFHHTLLHSFSNS